MTFRKGDFGVFLGVVGVRLKLVTCCSFGVFCGGFCVVFLGIDLSW